MKKKILMILILLCLGFIIWSMIQRNTPPESVTKLFEEYGEYYDKVAMVYYEDYQSRNVTEKVAYSFVFGNEYVAYTNLFEDKRTEITDEQLAWFKVVDETYRLDKKSVESIRVYPGFVSLGNENGRESFVYSETGKKPEYVNCPNDNVRLIRAMRINEHWYYVVGTR